MKHSPLWPVVDVCVWPWIGPPPMASGYQWEVGTLGIDALGTLWVCTVGGAPGTWAYPISASSTGAVTIPAANLILTHLPKADPGVKGQLWDNSGAVSISK